MHLQVVLIPVILEISSMLLNTEAYRVLFLNQTLLQIEKYIHTDIHHFSGAPRGALIVKHEFRYFNFALNN